MFNNHKPSTKSQQMDKHTVSPGSRQRRCASGTVQSGAQRKQPRVSPTETLEQQVQEAISRCSSAQRALEELIKDAYHEAVKRRAFSTASNSRRRYWAAMQLKEGSLLHLYLRQDVTLVQHGTGRQVEHRAPFHAVVGLSGLGLNHLSQQDK
jgi:hypothetical protein